jgi:cytochrome c5
VKKLTIIGLTLGALLLMVSAALLAEEEAEKKAESKFEITGATEILDTEFEYVGAKKCKFCHKDQYDSWQKTRHAKAWASLTEEEQKQQKCATCHVTGHDDDGELITGVECEACHGPGSEYKSPKIMNKKKWAANPEKYEEMAVEAGLIYPTEELCVNCHKKEGNPHFKPFHFDKMKPKVHTMSAEAAETKKDEK